MIWMLLGNGESVKWSISVTARGQYCVTYFLGLYPGGGEFLKKQKQNASVCHVLTLLYLQWRSNNTGESCLLPIVCLNQ